MTRSSGQGRIYELIFMSIVMYVLREGYHGGGYFCNQKLIYLIYFVYGTGCSVEWCRGQWSQVNKIEILRKLQKYGPNI